MNEFLFATCQIGAEAAVKAELARRWPDVKPTYSRPGFLTFKLPGRLPPGFDAASTFARCYGHSLGWVRGLDPHYCGEAAPRETVAGRGSRKASGTTAPSTLDAATVAALVHQVWKLAGERSYDRLHVFERDRFPAGEHDYDPGLTPEARIVDMLLRLRAPATLRRGRMARPGENVLDVILVGPQEWWVGWHQATTVPSRWPGGMLELALPAEAVSRAWLKTEEALRWLRLPLAPGQRCVELGAAPGGSCQALLSRGLDVVGIDPAAMHPAVAGHPRFVHVRKRAHQVRRREFRGMDWLFADINLPPAYTLDTVEAIVTYPGVTPRGLVLTLKLPEWSLAAQVPEWMARVASWGFAYVRARQLQFNRQEICLAALRRRPRRTPQAGKGGRPQS